MSSPTASLLVSCPDRKGLIAALARFLYDHGANILQAQQHTDPEESLFFQRIHFDLSELDISRSDLEDLLRIECRRYDMAWRIHYSDRTERVAIFASKVEHCLYDLLLRHRLGELSCDLAMIVSNHPNLEPVADQFGLPYHVFRVGDEPRSRREAAILALLAEQSVDVVILARYMQILSDEFVSRFEHRIINIHHGFLPAFVGARPYHQAHEKGVKLIGATAHYATPELDEGPIIAQDVVSCSHRDQVEDLVRKGRDVERTVLARAVRAHLEHRILVHGRRTVVF